MSNQEQEKEVVAVKPNPDGTTEEVTAESGGTYYAWSPITFGAERDDQGNILSTKVHAFGEKVSAGDLDITDEQFKELVDSGAVRNYPPPDDMPENYPRSPRDWMMEKHQLSEGHLAGGYFSPDVIQQLQTHADLAEATAAAEEENAKHEEGKVVQKQPGAANAPKPAGATS